MLGLVIIRRIQHLKDGFEMDLPEEREEVSEVVSDQILTETSVLLISQPAVAKMSSVVAALRSRRD